MAQSDQALTRVAVIGGGVAAAAACMTLTRAPVQVLRIAPADDGVLPVGETLSASARPVLEALDLWDVFLEQGFPAEQSRFSSWGGPGLVEQHVMMGRRQPGWYLDRRAFEAMLWRHCSAFDMCEGLVEKLDYDKTWRLELRDGRECTADFLIDCSGRRALVSRRAGERVRDDRLVAAHAFLNQVDTGIVPTPGSMTESLADGWWYSSILPNGQMWVAWFTDADLLPRGSTRDQRIWQTLLADSCYTARRIESAGYGLEHPVRVTGAAGERAVRFDGEAWVAAGDAALCFDPLSSHGMTSALWSGQKAARAVVEALAGDREPMDVYNQTLDSAWHRYRRQKAAIYAVERRFSDSPFWRRRLVEPGKEGI